MKKKLSKAGQAGTKDEASTKDDGLQVSPGIANALVIGSQSTPIFDKQFILNNNLHPKQHTDFSAWMKHYVLFVSDYINDKLNKEWQHLKGKIGLKNRCQMILHKGKIGISYDVQDLRSIYNDMSSEYMSTKSGSMS